MKRIITLATVGMLSIGLSACSSDDKKPAAETTTTAPAATPTLPETTTTTAPPSPYLATAEPTTGLKSGDTVTVKVSKFKAGLTLGINLCSQKGDTPTDPTGKDCALDKIATLTVGADGTGTGTINVITSPVGANKQDCLEATTRCFLSVGELSADPNAQRSDDVNLEFAK